MRILSDRRIRLEPGETIEATGDDMSLAVDGMGHVQTLDGVFRVQSPPDTPSMDPLTMVMRAHAKKGTRITLTSSSGAAWHTMLPAGVHTFTFLIEPTPDTWYCENDDGNPPHPVSKGDTTCPLCGGRVISDRS